MNYVKLLFTSAMISFFTTTSIIASDKDFEFLLNEITEIATKNRLNIDHTPGIISVISGKEMMKMGISHFDKNALNMIPGMTTMSSRKSDDYTKYLFQINGISINTEVTGVGILPKISTKSIKRIEIIRGASSALYGTSAYTALINIVTKTDENSVWIDYTNYSPSNHDVSIGALIHHKIDDVDLNMRMHTSNIDGLDQIVTQDGASLTGLPTNTPSKVNKSIDAYDIGLNLKYEKWNLDYERLSSANSHNYGSSGYYLPPNTSEDVYTETKDILEITNEATIDDLKINTKLGYMNFDQKTNDMYILPVGVLQTEYRVNGQINEQNIYATLEVNREFGNHNILLGGRYFHSNLYKGEYLATFDLLTGSIYSEPSEVGANMPSITREIKSIYLQDYYSVTDSTTLVMNLRYDHISDIDEDIISPRFAIISELNDENIIKFQYAQAYLTPLYFPLYSNPKTSFIKGNPDLEIDKAHTYELSHIYKYFNRSLKSTLYYVDMYSVATFISSGNTTIDAKNSKKSSGIEIEFHEKFNDLDLKANMSYNHYSKMKYYNGGLYEKEIKVLPDFLANIILNKDITKNLSTAFWYNYVGEKQQYLSTLKTDEKHLINLNLTYLTEVNDNFLSITLSANDILNQKDAEVPYANSFKVDEFINNTRRYMLQLSYIF